MNFNDVLWVLQRLNWLAVLDIFLVAVVLFGVLQLVRATQAIPLLRGVLLIVTLSALLSGLAALPTFGAIARAVIPALLVSIPVIFQPELRRALERLGRVGEVVTQSRRNAVDSQVRTVCDAARKLAALNHGALIVLERETGLQHLIETGTHMDAECTVPLLVTIFHPNTPLHDGGVIVQDNKILAAGCILPLTNRGMDDFRMGLRHRAGLGVTDATDAIAVIVSEERGTISIANNGDLLRNIDPDELEHTVLDLYPASMRRASGLLHGIQGLLKAR